MGFTRLFGSVFLLGCCLAMPVTAADNLITLQDAKGMTVGTAKLMEGAAGVLIKLEVENLPPGWHALHFHDKGICDDTGFQQSGSHLHGKEDSRPHGLLNPETPHAGDLPNIYVGADGTARIDSFNPFVTLSDKAGRVNLRDNDGAALIIHAKADDYVSQPAGNAGDRIACGVIR